MKKTGMLFMIFMGLALSACGASQRPALEQNRSLWESKAIQHYRFDLKVGCFCPWGGLMPLTVEVQNGRMVSMVAHNGGDISSYQDTFRKYATIDDLFDTINLAISKRVDKLKVEYDATYGFPTTISIDPSKRIMDDETGYYITRFEVLP